MDKLDIRYTEPSDGKYLKKWLSEDKKWYPVQSEKEINSFSDNWIGFYRFRSSLTAVLDKDICGVGTLFLMPYKKVAHQCMFYMIVGSEYRRKGIGRSLLKNVLNLAKNYFYFESIYAEIFERSPIEPLLQEFNFKAFVHQKNYVKEDGNYYSRSLYQLFFK